MHGLFKLPVPVRDNSTCNVPPTSEHAELLREIDPTHALRSSCYRSPRTTDPSEGRLLLGGDFRQVLPVALKLLEGLVAQYHLTSLTRPDGVEEWQRKRGQIAKLSQLALRLGKVRA